MIKTIVKYYLLIICSFFLLPEGKVFAESMNPENLPKVKFTINKYFNVPFDRPQALTLDIDNNELYVVDMGSSEILIFDLEGTPVSKLTHRHGISKPIDIATRNGKYYISQNGKTYLEVFDLLGSLVTTLSPPTGEFSPGMLFKGLDGSLYVINRLLSELVVFDSNDKFVRSIGKGDDKLLSLTGAAIGTDRIYLFTPFSTANAIHVYSLEGEYLYSFEAVAGLSSRGSLGLPIRGVVDNEKNLWVVDALKGILVFNSSNKKINNFGQLEKGGVRKVLEYPIDIDFGSQNEVYILEEATKEINIFR